MCRKLCHFIWSIWLFHTWKDFEAMKAGKLAFEPWLICPYNKNTLMDLLYSVIESKKLWDSDSVHFLRIGRKLKISCEITRSLANPADASLFSFFPTTHFHQKVLHILILQSFMQCHLVLFYLMQTNFSMSFVSKYYLCTYWVYNYVLVEA